jgi:hypothetical protein
MSRQSRGGEQQAYDDYMQRTLGSRSISDGFDAKATGRLEERRQMAVEPDTSAREITALRLGYDEEDDYEEIVPPREGFLDSLSRQMGAAPWWIISGAFHALVLLLVTLIGMAVLNAMDDDVVIVTDLTREKEPEKIEEPKERTIIPQPVEIEPTEIETKQQPIVTHEEVEIADHVETPNDSDAADTLGENGISDVWLGGSGTVAAIGLGGGAGGAFGRPGGKGGRLRRAIAGGGGKATESAVDKALEWLARNQEADGHWDTKKHGAKTQKWCDTAITGFALLAFLGAGHTEKVGKYRDNVQRAVKWLISQQQGNGALKPSSFANNQGYTNAIAGMALAEAGAMARIPETLQAAQKAVEYGVETHQCGNGSEKRGYRYRAKQAGDLSNTGWHIMLLKSAKVAGLHIPNGGFEGVEWFLDKVEDKNFKKEGDGVYDNGRHRYGYTSSNSVTFTRTAIGCLARQFMGTKAEELRGGVDWFVKSGGVPGQGKVHLYYWYYGTLCTFQQGGDVWKQWNDGLKGALLPTQCKGGDDDGSWNPAGAWSTHWGRVGQTALSCLCLEVYYRYLPMYRE